MSDELKARIDKITQNQLEKARKAKLTRQEKSNPPTEKTPKITDKKEEEHEPTPQEVKTEDTQIVTVPIEEQAYAFVRSTKPEISEAKTLICVLADKLSELTRDNARLKKEKCLFETMSNNLRRQLKGNRR